MGYFAGLKKGKDFALKSIRKITKKTLIIVLSILMVFSCFMVNRTALAATTLFAGDIVFIGLNSDGDDEFSLLLLKDITSGTSFYITDKGWNHDTGFATDSGDGIWEWTADTDLSAGAIIHIKTTNDGVIEPGSLAATPGSIDWVENNGAVLSYTGDQVFIYQGPYSDPTFIAGVHFNVEASSDTSNWDGSSSSNKTSALPGQLTNGVNAIWLYEQGSEPTERDNFIYDGSVTSGTPAQLRAAINNLDNWNVDSSNSIPYTINPFPYSFTVLSDNEAPTISTNNGLTLDEGATKLITSFELAATDGDSDPLTFTVTTSPAHGQIENVTNSGVAISSFTQQDINNNKIQYIHDDSDTTSDSFVFKVSDGTDEVANQTFNITINPIDDTAPTVNVTSTESDPTNNSPFTVNFMFSEDVTGFALGDISVGNGTASNFTTNSASSYSADITPSSEGTVTVDVAANVCVDAVGNNNTAASQFSIGYDSTPPSVGISSTESSPTNNSPFTVNFTFSEDVTGFALGDISVGNGAASNLVVNSASSYSVDITPDADGTITVDVGAGVCSDLAGNNNTAASQFSIVYDGSAPSVDITSTEGNLTNNSPFTVNFTFSEDVTGFALGDISVGNGTASNFTTNSASSYSADITPSSEGTVTVDVAANVCVDAVGNNNTAASQFSIGYDATAPTTSITSLESDPTNNSPFVVDITFSEDVTGFALGDINVGNGTASNLVANSASSYSVDITPDADGTITVDVGAGVCSDSAGNDNTAASQFSIVYDGSAPSVDITSTESNLTNNSPFTVNFTFSEDVTGFALGDINVGNGTASNFTTNSASSYSADITPSSEGTVTVDVAANVCADAVGNNNTVASQFSIEYDATAPTTSITSSESDPTSNSPFVVDITFSEDVTGFALSDISVGNGAASNLVANSALSYSADITPTTYGSVTVDVASSVCSDAAGNDNAVASQFSIEYVNSVPTRKSGVLETNTASVAVNTAYTLDLSNIFVDSNGDGLTYEVNIDGSGYVAADESYSYTPATTGEHILVFRANDGFGYSTETYSVTLTATSAPEPTITTTPTPTTTQTATSVAPKVTSTPTSTQIPNGNRTVTGTLLDADGNPLVGYIVELHSEPITTVTDVNGRYTFNNVEYTNHVLTIKTPEGEEIASFELLFYPGNETSTMVTDNGATITYTPGTLAIDIMVELSADQNSAKIVKVSAIEIPETSGDSLWWIWALSAMFVASLITWSILKRNLRKA